QFQSIIHREGSKGIFETSLQSLILWLHRYYNKRVIVLIDEYDAPIHAAYLHGYYDKMVEFMRGFLGDGLKDNALLEKAILTGILRGSKESIFSGFNNPTCYTLLDKK
ncbi:MAG: AAA family ATPase, partial [Chlamydiota bacterium]